MLPEEQISLDCPSCKAPIDRPLSWFKQTYSTCPACNAGLAASQFASILADLETALDAHIDEQLQEKPASGCGCGGGGCGGH
jgi:hypothetical protein